MSIISWIYHDEPIDSSLLMKIFLEIGCLLFVTLPISITDFQKWQKASLIFQNGQSCSGRKYQNRPLNEINIINRYQLNCILFSSLWTKSSLIFQKPLKMLKWFISQTLKKRCCFFICPLKISNPYSH